MNSNEADKEAKNMAGRRKSIAKGKEMWKHVV